MDDTIGILRQMLAGHAKNAELAEATGSNEAAWHRNRCRALQAAITSLESATGQTSDARDGLRAACERACRELPEGWVVRVCLERDAGTVELSDPDGYTANIDEDGDDRIVAEINAAIGLAMQEAGKS